MEFARCGRFYGQKSEATINNIHMIHVRKCAIYYKIANFCRCNLRLKPNETYLFAKLFNSLFGEVKQIRSCGNVMYLFEKGEKRQGRRYYPFSCIWHVEPFTSVMDSDAKTNYTNACAGIYFRAIKRANSQ